MGYRGNFKVALAQSHSFAKKMWNAGWKKI